MYMVLFLVLSVVGAWAAWRQNPMYSLGKTVRFLLVLVLMLAAFVAAMLETIRLTAGRSQGVQLGWILGLVGVGTVGMIGALVQMSMPAATPLPKNTKLLRVHRAKVDVWAKRSGWTLLVLAVLGVVLPGDWKIAPGVIGGLVLLLACSTLAAGYLSARKMDRWLTEVELRPWVHWTYTAEQWAAWNEARVAVARAAVPAQLGRPDWKKLVPVVLGMMVVPLFFGELSWTERGVFSLVILGLVSGGATLARSDAPKVPERLRARLGKTEPEVYFGDEGMYADGEFLPWVSPGIYLLGAFRGEGEPRALGFRFMKAAGGTTSVPVTQGVLLPGGAEADVERLQRELTAKCPTADVRLL